MQKFIISVKDKYTGRDVIPPYVVNSLDGFGNYSERISSLGLIIVVDPIREENNFVEVDTLFKKEGIFVGPKTQDNDKQ